VCFKNFGDRVKNWITINEPTVLADFGYLYGRSPPFRCSFPAGPCAAGNSSTEPYIVTHNIILAHAAAVRLYREKYQAKHGPAQFGMALETRYFKPSSDSKKQRAAADRLTDALMGWLVNQLHEYITTCHVKFSSTPSTIDSLLVPKNFECNVHSN
jgi:beta-glucosidase